MKRSLLFCLAFATLAACTAPKKLLVVEVPQGRSYKIDSTVGTSEKLTDFLKPYKAGVDTQMQVIVARLDGPVTKAQPESTMGNLVADAQLEAAKKIDPKVVAAVSNYGGLRIPIIPRGPVTLGKIYELMPFDNTVCIVEIPGKVVQEYCNAMAKRKGWPVSGISFTITKEGEATDILIGGQKVDPARLYKFSLNDYNARGGDNCDFLIPLKKRYTTVFIRDAIIGHLSPSISGNSYHPYLDNRVRYAE